EDQIGLDQGGHERRDDRGRLDGDLHRSRRVTSPTANRKPTSQPSCVVRVVRVVCVVRGVRVVRLYLTGGSRGMLFWLRRFSAMGVSWWYMTTTCFCKYRRRPMSLT